MCKVLWAALWVSDQCSLAGASGFCPNKLLAVRVLSLSISMGRMALDNGHPAGHSEGVQCSIGIQVYQLFESLDLVTFKSKICALLEQCLCSSHCESLSADFSVTGVNPCSCLCGKFGKGSGYQKCSCFTAVLAAKFQGAWAEKPGFVLGLESFFSPSFPWQAMICTTSSSSAACPVEVGE